MRVVILCSSSYSETGCAVAARLAQIGHTPIGALALPSWDRRTLLRKVGQWGLRDSYNYALSKLGPNKIGSQRRIRNPYLEPLLRHEVGIFCRLQDVAHYYGFPIVTCSDQNSPRAVAQMRQWLPDLAIFTGGNILRDKMLKAPRLGILNSHLALLPEIRGMSSPEWSLLCGVPLGITIHRMDSGIDSGPLVLRREFIATNECASLVDLRNRMIAEGIELIIEAVRGLDQGTITPVPQAKLESDSLFFVMHDRLKAVAARSVTKSRLHPVAETCDE